MNRLTRLVELRTIQEEVKAAAFGRASAHLNALREALRQLDLATLQGRAKALQDVGQAAVRLPPWVYEDYDSGQSWRRQQLQDQIAQAAKEVARTQAAWQAAHVQVKQVETLEDHERQRITAEANRRELRNLDDMGVLRHGHQES